MSCDSLNASAAGHNSEEEGAASSEKNFALFK
jgi:hypothetical protein